MSLYKNHDKSLDQFMSREEMENIYIKQMLYLKGISKKRKVRKTKQ